MLFDTTSNKIRLTRAELARLRQCAARNGYAIGVVNTLPDAVVAHVQALPPAMAADMLEFCETGSSPMTRCTSTDELCKLLPK